MSVVIVGGHDRMVSQYKKICKDFKCKAKVFTQMSANLSGQIGSPDLLILFTNTVSHKMVHCAVTEAEKCKYRALSYKQPECADRDPSKRGWLNFLGAQQCCIK